MTGKPFIVNEQKAKQPNRRNGHGTKQLQTSEETMKLSTPVIAY